MLSSKTVTSNLTSKTVTSTVKRGQTGSPVGGWGAPADDDRGCYDPVLLSMLPFSKLNSMLPSLWFRFNQPPHFSMFPYSMVNPPSTGKLSSESASIWSDLEILFKTNYLWFHGISDSSLSRHFGFWTSSSARCQISSTCSLAAFSCANSAPLNFYFSIMCQTLIEYN